MAEGGLMDGWRIAGGLEAGWLEAGGWSKLHREDGLHAGIHCLHDSKQKIMHKLVLQVFSWNNLREVKVHVVPVSFWLFPLKVRWKCFQGSC